MKTREVDGKTEYCYIKYRKDLKIVTGPFWKSDSDLDMAVASAAGAPNETIWMAVPDTADERWIKVVETIEGQDPESGDIISYEASEDTESKDAYYLDVLRADRNKKLAECDWTQLVDCQLDELAKTEWATYRQALRDLPANTLDYESPVWPAEPV